MQEWPNVLRNFLSDYSEAADSLFTLLTDSAFHTIQKYRHDHVLCRTGDVATCFWLIVEGQVDIYYADGTFFQERAAGELIGEMAFLSAQTPSAIRKGRATGRTADMKCHGDTTLLEFDAGLIERVPSEQRAQIFSLLANVVNEKLEQASTQRAGLHGEIGAQSRLLSRFCDHTALGFVRTALSGETLPIRRREVIVWFSDIAGFSTWANRQTPERVAEVVAALMGLQMQTIALFKGEIDKLMGDGLMAYWFCEGHYQQDVALRAYAAASQVVSDFAQRIQELGTSELSLRIGLHYGPACFGDFGTDNRIAVTLIGETVNRGARFEQMRASDVGRKADQLPASDPDAVGAIRVSQEFFDFMRQQDDANEIILHGPFNARVKNTDLIVYWS
ncbi:MAG: cyclic nucleotide-binding domain-containing protein [Rhodospirillaceae bacterium]|nr:MAG: cyclic nucleotide-binding domain-containing protein [Rhodospirillaceae bacterium]